jgi:hypothetical protein
MMGGKLASEVSYLNELANKYQVDPASICLK